MWEMYDALLDGIDTDDRIQFVCAGESWVLLKAENGTMGVAAVQEGRNGAPLCSESFAGMPLPEAAALVKSWDFEKASLGLAAINSIYNRNERFPDCGEADAFLRYRDRAKGKKVGVVGRFPYLEKRLNPICQLYVLERNPGAEDYPDSACEYLLPEMDLVFITGCTVSNKTLPRLLQLSQNAFTVLTGPSTPMSERMFEFGVDSLCGFCVTDEENAQLAAQNRQGIVTCGRMVCWEKSTVTGKIG